MRIAAWGFAAIVAAVALAIHVSARADEASPFPSPSPVSSEGPGSGGYIAIGVAALSASGGQVPGSVTSPSPVPFHSSGASGYSIELMGRLSASYISMLRFEEANLHGTDASVTSRFEASVLYQFAGTQTAAGIGYGSLQRSTIPASINGLGAGVAVLPDFARRVSPYASFFYYPSLAAPNASRGGLTVLRLGVALTPQRASGVFARVGFDTQHFGAQNFSPTALSGAEIGFGATF